MVPIFQVDAFTSEAFGGNGAGVCLLEGAADPAWMQSVAAEMNLAETAFVTPGRPRDLRWFSPTTEVDLCGHATLATAHVLWAEGIESPAEPIEFSTRSGILRATWLGDGWIELDLPTREISEAPIEPEVVAAFGVVAVRTATSAFGLIEVATEEEVRAATPDLGVLATRPLGYILTAQSGGDVVSRVFAPSLGIPEDPVTGSAQCVLGPWWAPRLGVDHFVSRQLSARGGLLRVRVTDERTYVAGQAVTALRGELLV